jgi:cytochrome c-type biogenesis protein CcmF
LIVYRQFGLMKFVGLTLGVWVMAVAFIDPVKYLLRKRTLRGYSRTMIWPCALRTSASACS